MKQLFYNYCNSNKVKQALLVGENIFKRNPENQETFESYFDYLLELVKVSELEDAKTLFQQAANVLTLFSENVDINENTVDLILNREQKLKNVYSLLIERENEQKRQKEVASPHASGFYQPGTFQRQMYRMPDMCRPLSEPGLAPDRIGIRFGLYVETTSGLYQQLLQLRVHSLFRCMPYRCDQTSDYRREDNDTGRHCHFLQRPLCC